MAQANRRSWERESYLDHIFGVGFTTIPKHKFVYLAGQRNMCEGVFKVWLDHWREYMEDQNEDIQRLMVGDLVVLWREFMVQKNGEPTSLAKALSSPP